MYAYVYMSSLLCPLSIRSRVTNRLPFGQNISDSRVPVPLTFQICISILQWMLTEFPPEQHGIGDSCILKLTVGGRDTHGNNMTADWHNTVQTTCHTSMYGPDTITKRKPRFRRTRISNVHSVLHTSGFYLCIHGTKSVGSASIFTGGWAVMTSTKFSTLQTTIPALCIMCLEDYRDIRFGRLG